MPALNTLLSDTERMPLSFGTSGRRGLLIHLSQLEIAINVIAELTFLQSLPVEAGGITPGDIFYFAYDLRPSSSRLIPGKPQRGQLAHAVEWAIRTAGMVPCNLGLIPTPALAHYALSQGKGCMMVTGSHIPFDRNGYKTYTACGELTKAHEIPIAEHVAAVRERLYAESCTESCFNGEGQFKSGAPPLLPECPDAAQVYKNRYLDFFGQKALSGLRLLVYQHSAVGRDILCEILQSLGAIIVTTGRSETFVPIDTENMDVTRMSELQALYEQAAVDGDFDAVVSTDGDSDRPLLLGVETGTGRLRFIGGDLLGMLTAEYLEADAVVVPISCNDAIDRGVLKHRLQAKTRIGSPYVIDGMKLACAQGKQRVCGFEANGGFMTGTGMTSKGRVLPALPTRDALLPLVAVLSACREQGLSVLDLCARLPERHGHAALLADFPRARGWALIRRFAPPAPHICEIHLKESGIVAFDEQNQRVSLSIEDGKRVDDINQHLSAVFNASSGFGSLECINLLDGLRLNFSNGDVAHIRPSGNADELRIYAVADTAERARDITARAVAQPNGILCRLEAMCSDQS